MIKQLLAIAVPLLAINSSLPDTTAHAENPVALSTYWKASTDAETNKNYTEALNQVAAFSQQGGDQFLALLRSGWLYYLSKDYDKAAGEYALASRMQPTAINPLLGLLSTAQAKNDANGVRLAAESLLRVDPLNYRAQMALAYVEFLAKDYQQAMAGYKRVLFVYPDDMEATSGAAWSAYYLGFKSDASAGFRKLLSVNADYPMAASGLDLASK